MHLLNLIIHVNSSLSNNNERDPALKAKTAGNNDMAGSVNTSNHNDESSVVCKTFLQSVIFIYLLMVELVHSIACR